MTRRTLTTLFGGCAVLGGVAWGASPYLRAADVPPPADPALASPVLAEMEQQNGEIALFEARALSDPFSAEDRAYLAIRYMQRARATGSHEDVVRAEQAARRSLEIREAHNSETWGVLSASLLEQHRFAEARVAAERLVQSEPENFAYRAYLAEIQMELGDYPAARTTFGSLQPAREHLDVAPRLARWLELTGRMDEARALLHQARTKALSRRDLPLETRAWYHLRVGDHELRNGRFEEAEREFRAGLAIHPGDYRLLAATARLHAARGDWDAALAAGEQVIGKQLDPGTLGLMSEVSAASGDAAQAEEYASVMQVAIQSQNGGYHREWGLFLLDHGQQLDEVLAQAREDLKTRRDIYGYDLLAWALHSQGEHRQAQDAMVQALRLGTRDPMLLYHAGIIARSLGDREAAEKHLEQALEINPGFHPRHAATARAALDSIRSEGPWYRRLGI